MEDFRRQSRVMRRWLPFIVVMVLALGTAVYLITSTQTEVFEAKGELIVKPGVNPAVGDMVVAEGLATQFADISRARDVSSAVIDELGLSDSVPEFALRRTVTSEPGSNIIEVTARSDDPDEAVSIVNALIAAVIANSTTGTELDPAGTVDSYLQAIRSDIARKQSALDELLTVPGLTPQQLGELEALEARLASLQSNYANLLPFSSSLARNQVSVLESPQVPTSAVEPRPYFWTMLTMTVAILLGAAIAFTFDFLRGRVRDRRDLELAAGLPVLGEMLEHRGDVHAGPQQRLVTMRLPRSSAAEMVRHARAEIESSAGDVSSLLVAACHPGDGGTSAAANLAVAYAETGSSVLLIDGNLREPRIHEYFGLPNESGVSSMLGYDVTSAVKHAQFVRPGLAVLTAGPVVSNPAEVVASREFRKLLERATAEADLVIVHGPSLPTFSDSLTIARLVQASLLVVAVGTGINEVRDVARSLSEAPRVNAAGTLLRDYTRRGHPTSDRAASEKPPDSGRQRTLATKDDSPSPAARATGGPGPYAIGRGRDVDRS